MASNRFWPFLAALFFFLCSWLLLGAPGFVHSLHRVYRRQEPSKTDLKIAKFVGYMGLFFGVVALIQGLIQLIG
jgi:hypothetical protein